MAVHVEDMQLTWLRHYTTNGSGSGITLLPGSVDGVFKGFDFIPSGGNKDLFFGKRQLYPIRKI